MAMEMIQDAYQILSEIGKGGTGTVYLAFHNRLQKYVVLKRLSGNLSQNDWRKEVDILKNLHHPNLPQVYDYFQEGDTVYTVMDYVEGSSLADYIAAGTQFPEQTVCLWLSQLADVLRYLHEQDPPILHCDIKPENIMITPKGDAVLIDFNVSLATDYSRLVGVSPAYASPEQMALAQEISCNGYAAWCLDARTDIYSLAATFYHVMTGKMPSAISRMQPLSEQETGYSENLVLILDRAMAFDREERIPTARVLQEALNKIHRHDSRYRIVLLSRIASILLSALLIAGGVYCLLVSRRAKSTEVYSAAIADVFSLAQNGEEAAAEQRCWEVLNDQSYQGLLNSHPEDRARLYGLLGDICFTDGRYASAADNYRTALSYAPEGARASYCKNAVVSCAQSGAISEAAALLKSDAAFELSSEERCYANAIVAGASGREAECLEQTRQLLAQSTDGELCGRACVAAATVCSDAAEQMKWLQLARNYSSELGVKRSIAVAYARIAGGPSAVKGQALQAALSLYRELSAMPYAARADRLNYAILLRMDNQSNAALTQLYALETEYPSDYRILTQLAYAAHENGNDDEARRYCDKALDAWSRDTSPDREDAQSDNIQQLKALAELLKR